VQRAELAPGDTLVLERELLLLVTRRPLTLPAAGPGVAATFAFGAPDAHGLVGESPAAWTLRERLAFAARADAHVLLHGASGTGKELAAAAIHRLSARAGRPFVARNAATFPDGLIDAELFGNVKNYPNPGMAERPGLVGEADGGTLFLDEIGELPAALQAHLLRVLDSGGEYQRLGDARPRRADVRVVAATNRDPGELKHDLAARLAVRVELPPLDARRDDVPLLVRHLARRAAAKLGVPEPELDVRLVEALVRHRYRLHARELEQILWSALAESGHAGRVLLTEGVQRVLAAGNGERDAAGAGPAREPTKQEIVAALAASGGSVSRAAKALAVKSRYALYRLMKKHGIAAGDDGAEE
jgi:DNA-binding NtrC family response regulator